MGHIGPFIARNHAQFKESPVFGLAGIVLPEEAVRPFSTFFLQLKEHMFGDEIAKSGRISARWERGGGAIFTPKRLAQAPELKRAGFRLISRIRECGGTIFYYGKEKKRTAENLNGTGFYKHVFSKTILQLHELSDRTGENFLIVVDEHSDRRQLMEAAEKTMFGKPPARRLISPPFQVESDLSQNIQAADWIAAIVGRMWRYELEREQFADHEIVSKFFWARVHAVASHSTVVRRPGAQAALPIAARAP
jgi:hypothetical protein